jgi:hypothetical protein
VQVKGLSKRSVLLRKALESFDTDDLRDFDGPLRPLMEFANSWHRYLGSKLSRKRTAIGRHSQQDKDLEAEVLEKLRDLSPPLLRSLVKAISGGEIADTDALTPLEALEKLKESTSFGENRQGGLTIPAEHEIDAMDRKYCNEALEKLDLILARASALQSLHVETIPNKRVRLCFEEGIRCYLYGFSMACAVMCRAIIEAALGEVIDPDGRLRPLKGAKGREASYYLKLVDNALWSGKLGAELVGPAEKIKEAGDGAVHHADKFTKAFPADKVEWLVDRTRDILVELYAAE